MNLSLCLESSATESVLLADYQLALKSFINKDIAKSFSLISKLQPAVYRSFSKELVGEETFVKITILYLTQVGLLLRPQDPVGAFQLNIHDKQGLVERLQKNEILDQLLDIYGSVSAAPLELVFNIYLVYYTCQEAIQGENGDTVLQSFKKTYHMLDFENGETDRHSKKWFDLYVLNVLPEAGDFTSAFAIAETNKAFGGTLMVSKLKEIQEIRKQQQSTREKEKKEAQAREAKRVAAEKERENKEAHEKSLKYRSLKQIRADQESRDLSIESTEKTPGPVPTLAHVRERLAYYYTLSKKVVRENSPIILAVVVLLVVAGQALRKKKVDLKQKVKDTLLMAFKVTYL